MKKILKTIALALLLTAMALPTQAQEDSIPTIAQGNSKVYLPDYDNKTFHFGFLLAFNEMTYALNHGPQVSITLITLKTFMSKT